MPETTETIHVRRFRAIWTITARYSVECGGWIASIKIDGNGCGQSVMGSWSTPDGALSGGELRIIAMVEDSKPINTPADIDKIRRENAKART